MALLVIWFDLIERSSTVPLLAIAFSEDLLATTRRLCRRCCRLQIKDMGLLFTLCVILNRSTQLLRGHVRKGPSAYYETILNLIACGERSLNSLRPCPWHFYDNIIALIFLRLSIGIPFVRQVDTGHRKRGHNAMGQEERKPTIDFVFY